MSPLLALILGALAVAGVSVLSTLFLERLDERDIEREEAERQMQIRLTIARLELGICAIHGHRYLPTFIAQDVQVWRCGACGDERGWDGDGA